MARYRPGTQGGWPMADPKYLIVLKGWTTAVPRTLRPFIAKKINEVYSQFNLELDFSDTRQSRDLLVTFSSEILYFVAYGRRMRAPRKPSTSSFISSSRDGPPPFRGLCARSSLE